MGFELWLVASPYASCTTVAVAAIDWKKTRDACRVCSSFITVPMTMRWNLLERPRASLDKERAAQ